MATALPILSLIVAALAVFIGPFMSLKVARRQVRSSLDVANKQIIAPMRQAWINNLRDLLSELASTSLHYYVAGFENRSDAEYQRLELLQHKIILMLNANETDHKRLEDLIEVMISALNSGRKGDTIFGNTHPAIVRLSREVLKREWDRVREPI